MKYKHDLSADEIQEVLIWAMIRLAVRYPDGLSRIEASIEAVARTVDESEIQAIREAQPKLRLVKGHKGGSG